MKLLVHDDEGRYTLPFWKIVSVRQSYDRSHTIVEAIINPGDKVRKFKSDVEFWVIARKIESITWKKIFNEAGISGGPWG